MQIMWIPHTPVGGAGWQGCRQYHLGRRVARNHEVAWISWQQGRDFRTVRQLGKWASNSTPYGTVYTVSLAANIARLAGNQYPRQVYVALNQALFRRAVKRIAALIRPDVAVYSSSHHATGFPPFRIGAPIVFDYVDLSVGWVERAYMRAADAVVAVSPALAAAAARHGTAAMLIPNGADVARYRTVARTCAKADLALGTYTVVSLIGLTCSDSLYFVEAIADVQRSVPKLAFLLVGGGRTRDRILQRAAETGARTVRAPGAVPNEDVHRYFAATDVGLYPGDDHPYFWGAAPLKIIEYAAASCQVVSSRVDMFASGWPNVRVVEASRRGFADGIMDALHAPKRVPHLQMFDWDHLSHEFVCVLAHTVGKQRPAHM